MAFAEIAMRVGHSLACDQLHSGGLELLSVAIKAEILSTEHEDTLTAKYYLSLSLIGQGRFPEASELLMEV
jgi:hypothetical protein